MTAVPETATNGWPACDEHGKRDADLAAQVAKSRAEMERIEAEVQADEDAELHAQLTALAALLDGERAAGWQRAHDDYCAFSRLPQCTHENPYRAGEVGGDE